MQVGLTTSWISFVILSLMALRSRLTASMKTRMLDCISSGVKPSWPTEARITPSFSRYSVEPTMLLTRPSTSRVMVPSLVLGISPRGPRTLPRPALLSLAAESVWHSSRSKLIFPSRIWSNSSSSPHTEAPTAWAAVAIGEGEGQMTAIRSEVLTGCGSRSRFRTAGPFLVVRSLSARSYLAEVGTWPTSKARM